MEKYISNLEKLQASLAIFLQNLKNIHWNVKGLEFFEMHEETDELVKLSNEYLDAVSEKIVMHDLVTPAAYSTYLKNSIIAEQPAKTWDCISACATIVKDLNSIKELVEEISLTSTVRIQPMLDEIETAFDKYQWWFKALIVKISK